MSYLIDTHVLIWSVLDPKKLSPKAIKIIEDNNNTIFCSSISIVEIALKTTLGRLDFPVKETSNILNKLNFLELKLTIKQAIKFSTFELQHLDPFDRILVAQAKSEKLHFITKDKQIRSCYKETIW